MTRQKQEGYLAVNLFHEAELREEKGDLRGSFECYIGAAKQGNALCQVRVGDFYSSGKGVKKDHKEAARWYKRAYRNGMSHAAINLSVDLTKQGNLRAATGWLKRAISMEDGEAYLALAKLYLGSPNRRRLAGPLLEKAAAFSLAHISEESKREASELLRDMQTREFVGRTLKHQSKMKLDRSRSE